MNIPLKTISLAYRWFIMAGVLLACFLAATVILVTGRLTIPTLQLEQWLLQRPITNFDCIITQWILLGEAPFGIFLVLVLALASLALGYRRRVFLLLPLLFLLGIGVEYAGKQYLAQPVPDAVQLGMDSLGCPQIEDQPRSLKLLVLMGMWWQAPPIAAKHIHWAQDAATAPLIGVRAYADYGYPSGHAMRWIFIGLIACWLAWRHIRNRILRWLLMALALAAAFGGGFGQFYTGHHLITDLLGGYLLGASLACCAIGLLLLNDTKSRRTTFTRAGFRTTSTEEALPSTLQAR